MTLSGSTSSLPYLEMSSASSASTPRGPGPPMVTFAAQTVTFGEKGMVLTPETKRRSKSKRTQRSLGIIQILTSIPLLITSSIMIPTKAALYFLGSGFFCAALFSVAGCLSVYAAKSRTSSAITASCIVSVISTFAGLTGLALTCLGLAIDIGFNHPSECLDDCTWLIFHIDLPTSKTEWFCRIAMHAANILTYTFAFLTSLLQVVVTCTVVCYRKSRKLRGDPIIVFQPGSEHLKFHLPRFKVLQQFIDDQSDNNSTQTNDSRTDVCGSSPVKDGGGLYKRLTEV